MGKDNKQRGDALKKQREAWGLTQAQLAEKLDLHPISLSRFERGAEPVPVMMELALCELTRRLRKSKPPSKKK